MMSLYHNLAFDLSKKVTAKYSTSFNLATNLLSPSVKKAIHSIYGFVRFADEIVDTFHDYDKEALLNKFEKDFYEAMESGISLNPILHSFQLTVKKYNIPLKLVDSFLSSMKMDLDKQNYRTKEEIDEYIYGSADVVGLMCLKVFVNGDDEQYDLLKFSAMKLGSAFQKVNFLRDLKDDVEILNRSYFPGVDFDNLDDESMKPIVDEIEQDFRDARFGIVLLPKTSRFGVYTAYIYYRQLLKKLKRTPSGEILSTRIRIKNYMKMTLLVRSYVNVKLNLL